MNVDELQLAEISLMVGIRPTLGLALTSIAVTFGYIEVDGVLGVLGHPVGLALACLLAVIEIAAERDDQMDVGGAAGLVRGIAAIIAVLTTSTALAKSMGNDLGAGSHLMHSTIATGTVLIRGEVRRRAGEYLASAGTSFVARIEEGGLVAIGVGVVFFPVLVMFLMLLLSVCALFLFWVGRWVDQTRRRACPACGCAAREEALRCPGCQSALVPTTWLTPPARFSRWVLSWGDAEGRPAAVDTTSEEVAGGPVRDAEGPRAIRKPYLGFVASAVLVLAFGAILVDHYIAGDEDETMLSPEGAG